MLFGVFGPELMTCGLSDDNAHPGAVRAYKELGWWKQSDNPLCTPMTYPAAN